MWEAAGLLSALQRASCKGEQRKGSMFACQWANLVVWGRGTQVQGGHRAAEQGWHQVGAWGFHEWQQARVWNFSFNCFMSVGVK